MGLLQSISFEKPDTTVVNSFSYVYNDVGQRTQETWADATKRVFGYDDKLQVTSAVRQDNGGTPLGTYDYSYLFDEIGNRETATANGATTTYTPNDVNQYTSLSGAVTASPTYDNNGNMLTDGLGATMTWDAENRMVSWEKGADKLEFVYDGMGRRVEKRKYVSAVLNETTRYLYDGLLPIAHLDGTNARTVELSRGMDLSQTMSGAGGIGGLLAYTEGSNASEFYSYDGNGNVIDLLDTSNAVVGHYEYSPFGEMVTSTGASTNPYRWSSKEEDTTSDLVYYLYRYYDADLGRWINRDPIGESGGRNLYCFVGNSIINQIDTNGLLGGFWGWLMVGLVGEGAAWLVDDWLGTPIFNEMMYDAYGGRKGFMDATERELMQRGGALPRDLFRKSRRGDSSPIVEGSGSYHDRLQNAILASSLYQQKRDFILRRIKEGTADIGFLHVDFQDAGESVLGFSIGGAQLHYEVIRSGDHPVLELHLKDSWDFTNKGHAWDQLQQEGLLTPFPVNVFIEEIPCQDSD